MSFTRQKTEHQNTYEDMMKPIVIAFVRMESAGDLLRERRQLDKAISYGKVSFSPLGKGDNILLKSVKHEEIEPSLHVFHLVAKGKFSLQRYVTHISYAAYCDVNSLLQKISVSLFCIKAYLITSCSQTS
jgi:hypothetical protein